MSLVLRGLLTALFLMGGALKLAAEPGAVESFGKLGLGQGFRIFVGLCEVAGAAGLWIGPLVPVAAVGLAALMVGAVASHLLVLGPSAVPAAIVFLLCLIVAWIERGSLTFFSLLGSGKGPMDGWVARNYDRGVQAAFREIFPKLAAEVLEQVKGARRALDVGCGPGQFTIEAAEALPDAEVVGIDIAPTMIELARRHAAESPAAARLRFEIADVAKLPFPDGHFDVVMSSGSIKHWPDPVAGLHEIHRVLAPGGRAFIGEMNRVAPPEAIAEQQERLRHWFFRRVYPRVFTKALSPEEARSVFSRSPFGAPADERMLLGGVFWLFEGRKGTGG